MGEVSISVRPNPDKPSRWEYFQARSMEHIVQNYRSEPEVLARELTHKIFDHHPDELDLPPHIYHRYKEVKRIMEVCGCSDVILNQALLNHFEEAKTNAIDGIALSTAVTLEPLQWNKTPAVKIHLPSEIQHRLITINTWIQTEIQNGNADQVFGQPPLWTVTKLVDGTWLPVGNLMVEVTQGVGRLRTPFHDEKDLIERWGFTHPRASDMVDLNRWVVMTHIVDKGLINGLNAIGRIYQLPLVPSLKLTKVAYIQSYQEIAELIKLNPHLDIPGVLSDGSWIYDPALADLFPDQEIAQLFSIAGDVVPIASAQAMHQPIQITFATGDATRKKAYGEGRYCPTITARFITNQQIQARIDAK